MFQTESLHNSTDVLKEEFIAFCKNVYEFADHPSKVNMWHPDWENKPETLPFLVYKSDRFSNGNGNMYILRVDGEIKAVSGIYISEFDRNVAIGGVRSWTDPEYRTKLVIGRHIFPLQLSWAKEHSIKTIALTFNEYNSRLVNYFTRNGLGVTKNRTKDMLFYNGVHKVEFPIMVQNTKQWAVYHKIDESYEPIWESIRYKE